MAWTVPRTWAAGEVVTGAQMNTELRDNLRYLKGLDGRTDLESAIAFTNDETSTLTGSQNNVVLAAGTFVFRWNGVSTATFTGLTGGVDGRLVIVVNVATVNLVLNDEDAASTAANRFALSGNITLSADQGIVLVYDSTSSRWRELSTVTRGGTPAVVLSATAAAGTAATFLRTDDQLIAFDTTAPVTQASADAAATGSAAVAARRDHRHGMPTISTGAAVNRINLSAIFESIASRYDLPVAGGGTRSATVTGVLMDTSTTTTSSTALRMQISNLNAGVFAGSPVFAAAFHEPILAGASTTGFMGIGAVTVSGTGHTFTVSHIGFKSVGTAVSATQADGTTENASATLRTLATDSALDLIAVVNGTSSVDYYTRLDGGALSSATNLTTNLPTSAETQIQISGSNNSTTQRVYRIFNGMSYNR